MSDEISPDETAEEFQARYPRPKKFSARMTRVLVRCACDHLEFEHWGWGYWVFDDPEEGGGLSPYETLAEPRPVAR